jgi:hypothetical protein
MTMDLRMVKEVTHGWRKSEVGEPIQGGEGVETLDLPMDKEVTHGTNTSEVGEP